MEFKITTLAASDVDRVDELMKQNSRTLGFLPREALIDYLGRGTVLGVSATDSRLIGYLLYASYPERFRVAHLCISERFRGRGIAKRLINELKAKCTTQCVIRLNCRRDYEAHNLWPRLGFVPVDEKPGRSLDGHLLTCWEHRVGDDRQLDIFKECASDQAVDVAIDTHILLHFNSPQTPESAPSKALLADFLADLVRIRITDEVFIEIDRQADSRIRRDSRVLAHSYSTVNFNSGLAEQYEKSLRNLLRPTKDSDESDIRHLAKTAASGVAKFVTLDEGILRYSKEIAHLTQLDVISPIDLVIRLYEPLHRESYRRYPISGQDFVWHRARADDIGKLLKSLLRPGEVKGKLRETLYGYLAKPEFYKVEILLGGEQVLGVRVLTEDKDCVTISFVRAATSNNQLFLELFLVADILTTSVVKDFVSIRIEGNGLPNGIEKGLLEMGFARAGSDYVRLCLTGTMSRNDVHGVVRRRFPELSKAWNDILDREILTCCSPVVLKDCAEACYIVPIKPAYAMSLFDKQSAGEDLFGGRSQILMRWDNAYFRRKTHHKMIKAPARLLWYESGKVGAITAASHLRSMEVGSPKHLFRKFQKFGTLDWDEIFAMCKGDIKLEIMALEFFHTFPFRKRVTLAELRKMEGRQSVPLQSPRSINFDLFLRIVEAGYTKESK